VLGVLEPVGVLNKVVVSADELAAETRWRTMARDIIDRLSAALTPVSNAFSVACPECGSDVRGGVARQACGQCGHVASDVQHAPVAHIAPKELQALHNALFPPKWVSILQHAIEVAVRYRIEIELRAASQTEHLEMHLRGEVPLEYAMDERNGPNGKEILRTLRASPDTPPEERARHARLIGEVPRWLTAQHVDQLIKGAVLGAGGRNGGWTPERAARMVAASPTEREFRRAMKAKADDKEKRRNRTK
jgi:hypothetical protein